MGDEKKLRIYTNQLYLCFKFAHSGKLSVERLKIKGRDIADKLNSLQTDLNKDIKEIIGFLGQLHDKETREYHQKNKERIYYYLERLKRLV